MGAWNMFDWISNRVGQNNAFLENPNANFIGPQNAPEEPQVDSNYPSTDKTFSKKTSTQDNEFGAGLLNIVKNIGGMQEDDLSWADKNKLKRQLREDFRGEDMGAVPGGMKGPFGKIWETLSQDREKLGGESVLSTFLGDSGEEGVSGAGGVNEFDYSGMQVPQYRSNLTLNPIQSAGGMPSHTDFMQRLLESIKGVS